MINWKRALIISVVLWLLIFFEVSILFFGFGLSPGITTYYIVHYLLFTFFIIIFALIYFNIKNVEKGAINGLVLGLIFVVTEIILDSVIIIPLFNLKRGIPFSELGGNYAGILFSTEMLISYLFTVILCAVVGWFKKLNKNK